MNELIGYTVKTHDSQVIGKVNQVERITIGEAARLRNGIEKGQPYVAYAVAVDEKPSGWTTLIASDELAIHKRYVM